MGVSDSLNTVFTIVFLMVAGAVLALQYKKSREGAETAQIKENDRMSRTEILWLLSLLLAALMLRLFRFGTVPDGMNQDGAMAAVDARALCNYGTDRYGMHMPVHFTAWGYGQMSVLMSYCMIPFIKLLGLTEVAVRLPVFIASMVALAALYFTGRRLAGAQAAGILLAFAVCNPWHFMLSRWALDCNMFPHVFLFGFVLLLYGMGRKKGYVYLSMVFFGLCMYCYGIAFYTVPVFLAVMCIYLLCKKLIRWQEALLCVSIWLFVSWPVCMTMVINAFGLQTMETPFFTIPFFPGSMRSSDILFYSDRFWEQLRWNFQSLVRIYTEGDNLPWNTVPGFGAVTKCFLPFVLLGVVSCIRQYRKQEDPCIKAGYLSVLCFFGTGNLAGLITANVNVNRVNILMYALLIMAGLGIWSVVCSSRKLALPVLPVYLLISVLFLNTYFTTHADVLKKNYYGDFLRCVRYASENTSCSEFVITPDVQYPGYWNVSEILTLYALDVDALFYQGKTRDDNGLYYGQKFQYHNAAGTVLDAQKPVAYIVRQEERAAFWGLDYDVVDFGDYCAAVPSGYRQ